MRLCVLMSRSQRALFDASDPVARAVVERDEIFVGEMDHATYERPRVRRLRVRYLERLALGTSYPTVVYENLSVRS